MTKEARKSIASTHRPSAVEYDSQRKDVLNGHDFHAVVDPPNLVRVFVSSTFHDFLQERNFLYNNAFRTLETWCRERGLEFQVVDLRWGVRPGSEASDGAAAQCLREVEACQNVSVGPNFVAFLGDRYGFRPLPPVIPLTEWKIICDNVADKKSKNLLASAYRLDENCLLPELLLEATKEDDPNIRDILEKASAAAVAKGDLTETQAYKYFASMTEQEVWKGILSVEEPERFALCFNRTFSNFEHLKPEAINKQIAKYIDVDAGSNQRNENATKLLTNLKKFQIPTKLESSNLVNFTLMADLEQGVNPELPEHKEYMEKLNKILVDKFQDMITSGIKRQVKTTIQDAVYREVAQHASFCISKCQLFTGRKSFVMKIIEAVQSNDARQPVVIWGESGVGKTAAMAKLIFEASQQLKPKVRVVYRFLGITAASSSVDQLLLSVTLQIAQIYSLPEPTASEKEFNNLRPFFSNLLKSVSDTKDKPLLIFFDSLDQLSPVYGAYTMNWLPIDLPPNVTIVLSGQPQTHNILPRLQGRIKPCNVYQIRPMSNKSAGEVIKLLVEQHGRKLQANQMAAVEKVVTKNSSPLLIHLIALEALKWHSFTPIENIRLPSTIRDAIQFLFDRLEKSHGKVLVGRALGYLVLSKNGLSEKELQEILSLDDEVLQELYMYWDPPNVKHVQLPSMQWARFKFDMTDFISQRTCDDMTVITLYHRQFIEVILARYVSSVSEQKRMFKTLADFFAGKWYKEPKALKLIINNKDVLYNPQRGVRSQPLKLGGRFNLRKLNNLPYYLHKGGAPDVLSQSIFYNYEWLDTKYRACGIKSILDDFALLNREEMDNPLNCIKQAIRLAKVTLEFPDNQDILATEFLGRLRMVSNQQPAVKRLLDQCEAFCCQYTNMLLVPVNQCFLAPNGLLLTTLAGHKAGVLQVLESPDQTLLITCSMDKTIRIWDLETDTVMHIIDVNMPAHMAIGESGEYVFLACKDCVLMYEIKTGILKNRIEPPHEFRKKAKETVKVSEAKDVKPTMVQCIIDHNYLITSYGNNIDLYQTNDFSHFKRFEVSLNTTFMKLDHEMLLIGLGTSGLLAIDIASLKLKPRVFPCNQLLASYVQAIEGRRNIISICHNAGKTCVYSNGKLAIDNLQNGLSSACNYMQPMLATAVDTEIVLVNSINWESLTNLSLPSSVTELQFINIKDETSLLVGCRDATVRLYNVKGELKRYLTGFWSGPTSFYINKNILITSSSDDPFVKLWNLGATWGPDTPMHVASLVPLPAVFCRNDGTFIVCSTSIHEKALNISDQRGIQSTFNVDSQLVGMSLISADKLLTVDSKGDISLRSVEKGGMQIKNLASSQDVIVSHHLSLKASTVAFLTNNRSVLLVDISSGSITPVPVGITNNLSYVFVINKSSFIVCGQEVYPVLMNSQGKTIYELHPTSETIKLCDLHCCCSSDKMFAYYDKSEDEIYLHQLEKRELVCAISKIRGAVACLNLTDDEQFLLVGMATSDDISLVQRQILLYDTKLGNLIRAFYVYAPVVQMHSFGDIIGATTGLGYFCCFRLHNFNADSISRKKSQSSIIERPKSITSNKSKGKKSKMCSIL